MTATLSAPAPVSISTPSRASGADPRSPESGELQTAMSVRAFAIAALSRVLEAIDGRRARTQLVPCLTADVLAQITELVQGGSAGEPGCARLHRVHVQLRDEGGAEFFGTYARGERVRAVAGRIERRPVRLPASGHSPRRTEDRWVLAEFAIL